MKRLNENNNHMGFLPAENVLVGSRKAISTVLIQFKTHINFDRKEYMIQQIVLGLFKSGEFKKLPKLDYVLLATTYFQPGCENCVLDDEEKKYYQVSLVHHKSHRIITQESKNFEEAMSTAKRLSEELQLPMKDASVRGKAVWAKPIIVVNATN